jgi:hypothetical protein
VKDDQSEELQPDGWAEVYALKAERAEEGSADVCHGPQLPVMDGKSGFGAAAANGAMTARTVVTFMVMFQSQIRCCVCWYTGKPARYEF